MSDSREALLQVLDRARGDLLLAGNDFSWSSWADQHAAIAELDDHITRIRAGAAPDVSTLTMLFAPTGSIQEVSLSSGWGDAFLGLAKDFDSAIALFETTPPHALGPPIWLRLLAGLFGKRA